MNSNPLLCVDHVAVVEDRCLVAVGWAYHSERQLASVRVEAKSGPLGWRKAKARNGLPPFGELFFGSRDDVRAHLGLTSAARLGFAFVVPTEQIVAPQPWHLRFHFEKKLEPGVAINPLPSTIDQIALFLEWYTDTERAAVLSSIRKQLPDTTSLAVRATLAPKAIGALERCTAGKCVGWLYDASASPAAELWFGDQLLGQVKPTLERTIRVEGQERTGPFGFEFVIRDALLLERLSGPVPVRLSLRAGGVVVDSLVTSTAEPFRGALERFEDGVLRGWAVCTADPARVVELELLVNHRPVLTVRADRNRGDLARRGLSAGLGGFVVAIPFSPSSSEASVVITARERETGLRLGKALSLPTLPSFAPRFLPFPAGNKVRPVTVVITVYDAAEEVAACLESVRRNTQGDVDVVVIDDASPSKETRVVLKPYANLRGFRVVRNFTNKGYTASVNRGIEKARPGADIILLNSDTRVPPRWVQTLREAAYSGTRVATATAISHNAGAFSVPVSNHHNELPPSVPFETLARRVTQGSAGIYAEVPTGSGFCLYIRRDYLDEVGPFDEAAFPRGYGEENDFCMRGVRRGWTHLVDDRTYVGHTRSASFRTERATLVAQGRAVVDTRFPEYSGLVRSHFDGVELAFVRLRSGLSLGDAVHLGRPRLLFVISTTTGGTPQTNRDLMEALSGEYDTWLLRSDSRRLTLEHLVDGTLTVVAEHVLAQAISPGQHVSDEYDHVVRTWLWRYAIELVHVRHIAWHGLGLTSVAKAMDIPVVFSFHDYYTACPSVKLLDEKLKHCGGQCTPWTGTDCSVELWSQAQFPRLKGDPVLAWRARMERMLADCDAFVTTSESAARIVERTFPRLARRGIQVIPHGRDFAEFSQLAAPPIPGVKPCVVVPGNISIAKGALILKELIELAGDLYEFHIVGEIHPCLRGLGVAHGRYARSELPAILTKIGPSVGLILSIWPETYCHTLTELWASGIPVIAFDIGAVGDRLRETPGGWLVKEMTPEGVANALALATSDSRAFSASLQAVKNWQAGLGSEMLVSAMAANYVALYRREERRGTIAMRERLG